MFSRSVIRANHALAFAVLMLLGGSLAVKCQTLSVSIPSLHATAKERVVGFEFHVRSGMIARLPNVPYGWSISIDNDPSWNTVIRGSIAVGAASVDPEFFRDFLVIEVEKNAPSDMKFDLQGEVIVTEDFVNEKRIKLENSDFVFKQTLAKSV